MELKKRLTEAPVLATPADTGTFWLDCDGSDFCLGQCAPAEARSSASGDQVCLQSIIQYGETILHNEKGVVGSNFWAEAVQAVSARPRVVCHTHRSYCVDTPDTPEKNA